MDVRDEPEFRVVTVERAAREETLVLAAATGREVLTVTPLPDDLVRVRMR